MIDSKPSNPYYIINERHEVVEVGSAAPGAEIIPGRDEMLVWGEAPDITAKQAEPTPYRIRDADGFVRIGAGAVPDYELGPGEQIEYAPELDGDQPSPAQHCGHAMPCIDCVCGRCDAASGFGKYGRVTPLVDRGLLPSKFSILQEAQTAVYGERQKTYGHPRDDFRRTATLWRAWLLAKHGVTVPLDAFDVAKMMRDVKDARLITSPLHRDSHIDIAGYAAAGARAVGVDV